MALASMTTVNLTGFTFTLVAFKEKTYISFNDARFEKELGILSLK